jgi:manganese transport protein
MAHNLWSRIGPGAIVSAAFIGPGTVTSSITCGAQYGYVLLWAVTLSVIMTTILQEMSLRLGIVGNMGLGTAIRSSFTTSSSFMTLSIIAVLLVIVIGNSAYEAGNLTGSLIGIRYFGEIGRPLYLTLLLLLSMITFVILYIGRYKLLERILIVLVGVMGLAFILLAVVMQPDWTDVIKSLFIPTIPPDATLMVVSIIGTTVVPYNLFLHASSVRKKWHHVSDLQTARWDAIIGIGVGGLITAAILICASIIYGGVGGFAFNNPQAFMNMMSDRYGVWSGAMIAIGYFAAGFSSAITAPYAAALAASELLGWKDDDVKKFRIVWMIVLGAGVLFSSCGIKPLQLIVFAQFTNGLLLPIIALFLIWVMNNKKLLGTYVNQRWVNVLALLSLMTTIVLAAKTMYNLFWA